MAFHSQIFTQVVLNVFPVTRVTRKTKTSWAEVQGTDLYVTFSWNSTSVFTFKSTALFFKFCSLSSSDLFRQLPTNWSLGIGKLASSLPSATEKASSWRVCAWDRRKVTKGFVLTRKGLVNERPKYLVPSSHKIYAHLFWTKLSNGYNLGGFSWPF